jgi:hypothetical protein
MTDCELKDRLSHAPPEGPGGGSIRLASPSRSPHRWCPIKITAKCNWVEFIGLLKET